MTVCSLEETELSVTWAIVETCSVVEFSDDCINVFLVESERHRSEVVLLMMKALGHWDDSIAS